MDITFHGKRALVTGGGRGFGRDIARSLVKCGAKTIVLTKSTSSVESLRKEDPDIEVVQVDLANWENAKKAVESVLPIDLLVNNAGIINPVPFLNCTETDVNDHLNIHYKATFIVAQIVARDMVRRNAPGSIVNMSSMTSHKHYPDFIMYGSNKAAIDSLTKYMALDLGPKQIRVNSVNPTFIPTDLTKPFVENDEVRNNIIRQIPLGRLGRLHEMTNAVLFLLSDRASLINGVTLLLDGGMAL